MFGTMRQEETKRKIGEAAANIIQDGMTVGLGSGSTAFYFIQSLISRCKKGLKIHAAATSKKTLQLAREGGIPLVDVDHLTTLDITVDGADEIDPLKRMIKGGGGALVREKIIASMSLEVVIIVDESKLVDHLGTRKLPVEIIPFAHEATKRKIEKLGFNGEWRKESNGSFYITDNNNLIFDIHFPALRQNPEQDNLEIRSLPGVVETGFFFNIASKVMIGFFDGQIVTRP